MGFTDETVRFNLDDGSKDEISNTLTNVIILSTKLSVMF